MSKQLKREELDRITDETNLSKHQMRIIRDYASSIEESIIRLDLATDLLSHGHITEEYYKKLVEHTKGSMRKAAEYINQMIQDPEEENL